MPASPAPVPPKVSGRPSLDRALVWFRRDLRADDHAALYHALRDAQRVWCVFVFDTDILDPLLAQGARADRRVEFIRDSLVDLDAQLRALGMAHGVSGVGLIVLHGAATQVLPALARRLGAQGVYTAHDDEPAALHRDATVRGKLADAGIVLHTSKDHVVFERNEVMTGGGGPYSVFTPYKNAWLKRLEGDADHFYLRAYPVGRHAQALAPVPGRPGAPAQAGIRAEDLPSWPDGAAVPPLEALGFERTNLHELRLPSGTTGGHEMLADFLDRIDDYAEARDFPAVKGPSYLSTHLRFGTVSIRRLAREAHARMLAGSRGAEVWLSELIWRDFYHQVLFHHPHVAERAFRPEYDHIRWDHGQHADALFDAWCQGRTGYPLVDAAMRQLFQTGYMHNRLRMVTASFLTKDLGLDWRRGEAWFALHLNDFDLAANNGGWQWAASTGTDAQPYFRIFNPVSQSVKFDEHGRFIRRYVPEVAGLPDKLIHAPWKARPVDLTAADLVLGEAYPKPVVDHETARERTLARYKAAREKAEEADRKGSGKH